MNDFAQNFLQDELTLVDGSRQQVLQLKKLDVSRDASVAVRCKDWTHALREMFKASDFDSYESLADAMGMDKGRFSRVLSKGDASFTDDQMGDYMRLTGSVIAPLYLLHVMSLDPATVRYKQTETERLLAVKEKEVEDLKTVVKYLTEAKG